MAETRPRLRGATALKLGGGCHRTLRPGHGQQALRDYSPIMTARISCGKGSSLLVRVFQCHANRARTGRRPIATYRAIRRLRLASIPAGRNAQIAAFPDRSNRPQTAVSPVAPLGWIAFEGRRAAQAFLVLFCVTREARRGRNPQACSDSGVGRRRL
jgi:hypothetical protein